MKRARGYRQLCRCLNECYDMSQRYYSQRYGNSSQKRQRCQLTQQTVMDMDGAKRDMPLMWNVVDAFRASTTCGGFIMDM